MISDLDLIEIEDREDNINLIDGMDKENELFDFIEEELSKQNYFSFDN